MLKRGNKYYFGNIKFLGNTVYRLLSKILGVKRETYNGVLLEKESQIKLNPDGEDITNLYQNSGYLFSNNAVEVKTVNDYFEIE
jgi:outer membrane protein insertion porin family